MSVPSHHLSQGSHLKRRQLLHRTDSVSTCTTREVRREVCPLLGTAVSRATASKNLGLLIKLRPISGNFSTVSGDLSGLS